MFKKLLAILTIFMLIGCTDKQEIVQKEYIDPAMDIFIFGELDETSQSLIKKANGNNDFNNFQFKMLNKAVYAEDLIDINGNTINLKDYDKFVLEIVSAKCIHCQRFVENHIESMLNHNVQIIQYFNLGTNDEIYEFYKDIGMTIPENLIVIAESEELDNYIEEELKIESYPSLVSYLDGLVSFNACNDLNDDELESYFELSFDNIITNDDHINELIKASRSIDDVENSICEDNLDKINKLDNDGNTLDYTLKIIGTKLDFDDISNKKSSVYINEIESFEEYKNEDLVLIYTYLSNAQDVTKVNYINKLIDSNDTVEYIVVLIEGMESSSNIYKEMDVKFHSKVVSVLGYIPDDFFTLGMRNYPVALFVEKGTFTGAYSNINSIDNFNKAIDMFIGENSIALKENN